MRTDKMLILLAIYFVLFLAIATTYLSGRYVEFALMLAATVILSLAMWGFKLELRNRLQLKEGMVFMDGGVKCPVGKNEEGELTYRSYILSFASRDEKEGVVIYSSYNSRKNGERAYGVVAYNAIHGVMMTPEKKKVTRIDNIKTKDSKNAILRRKK